jgi:hypothetical protein
MILQQENERGETEVGVLNRNIASSARLFSYGTGPPGYIGWAYVAWQAGTNSAYLAQPCLNLQLLSIPSVSRLTEQYSKM